MPSPRIAIRASLSLLLVSLTCLLSLTAAVPSADARPYRAFSDRSYWNRPLPRSAPRDPNSAAILRWLKNDNDTNYIRLAGVGSDGSWGMPIYWATRRSKVYDVRNNCSVSQPPEFRRLRIPRGARPDPTSDAAMTVYDRTRDIVVGLFHARYDAARDVWSSCGGTVYYTRSNGLHRDLPQSNHKGNRGHRGVPPPTWAVRYDEVVAGRIPHVLKISVHSTRCEHVFPMVGNECGTRDRHAPPEGTRIRIRPNVDLSKLRLSRAGRVLATALQRYGAVIGDQSGGSITLKLENTVAAGRGQRWDGLLSATSLRAIPLRYFEVIRLGYGR